jgi:hypothetical protein
MLAAQHQSLGTIVHHVQVDVSRTLFSRHSSVTEASAHHISHHAGLACFTVWSSLSGVVAQVQRVSHSAQARPLYTWVVSSNTGLTCTTVWPSLSGVVAHVWHMGPVSGSWRSKNVASRPVGEHNRAAATAAAAKAAAAAGLATSARA